ncbi:metallophosphoesterase family protein [Sorangium sp. So ce1000]|uniref:metallophosphoesterase family protein n=1 Tax=Sorangium sp. So ce1000 TaxID=3133325 RepID=UPI003F5D826C
MHRISMLLVVAAAMTACAKVPATPARESPSPLRVGLIGDQTGVADPDALRAAYEWLGRGAKLLSTKSVKVMLHVGDLLETSYDYPSGGKPPVYPMKEQFLTAARALDSAGVPWFVTPGDHDVDPQPWQPLSTDRSREQLFQRLYSERRPEAREHLYYSFDVDGYHFISIDAIERFHVDPRWGDVFLADLSEEQLAWLKRDLEAHRGAPGIVVFLHQPLWYNQTGWGRVHQLLKQYPVAAVIAGHFHYDQDDGVIDGIRYLVLGATGADTKHGSVDAGNVRQVGVLSLKGRHADVELWDVGTGKAMPLTPRVDADRIQAVDQMLGSAAFDLSSRTVVVQGDQLASCDGKPPLLVRNIGDPIDVTLQIGIAPADTGAFAVTGAFASDACVGMEGGECQLAPGARVSVSNVSSVEFPDPAWGPGPLWTATARVTGPQAPIDLVLRASFAGKMERYTLEKTATLRIAPACPTGAAR